MTRPAARPAGTHRPGAAHRPHRTGHAAPDPPIGPETGGGSGPGAPGEENRQSIYLHPGQLAASERPATITTILGSCVAVCLWDPARRIGGMNHYLLPRGTDSVEAPARFGCQATHMLIERLIALGCDRRSLRAKLFGGASVLGALRGSKEHLGSKNVTMAREVLAAERIPIVGEDVGGERGRKLIFRTDDGAAQVKAL